MHPVAWLIWTACATAVAVTTTDPFYLATLVAVAWFVAASCRASNARAASFRFFVISAMIAIGLRTALVFLGTVDAGSVAGAAAEGARIGALLVVYGTFNVVSDPYGVVRLAPRRFYEPALAAALALSIAPRTIDAAGKVREAQRLRGIGSGWRGVPALAVPVLETGLEEAMVLAESMDARGHGAGRRTRYRPDRWTLGAAVCCGLALVAAIAFVAAARAGMSLYLPVSPTSWPQTSPALIGAICLLAAPGLLARQAPPRAASPQRARPDAVVSP